MNTENKEYCYKCGKECMDIELDSFDIETGKRKTRKQCPTRLCEHTGKEHGEMVMKNNGFFRLKTLSCVDCGKEFPRWPERGWP